MENFIATRDQNIYICIIKVIEKLKFYYKTFIGVIIY